MKPRRIIVTIPAKEVTISRCYHECPFFSLDGNTMFCDHPSLKDASMEAHFIIFHRDCDNGFPKECPLLK